MHFYEKIKKLQKGSMKKVDIDVLEMIAKCCTWVRPIDVNDFAVYNIILGAKATSGT